MLHWWPVLQEARCGTEIIGRRGDGSGRDNDGFDSPGEAVGAAVFFIFSTGLCLVVSGVM
jgi:hypothetical protein